MKQMKFEVKYKDEVIPCMYLTEPETIQKLLYILNSRPLTYYGLDTETEALPEYQEISTAALSPHTAKIRLLQLYDGECAYVIDMRGMKTDHRLISFLECHKFVAHNAVFDLSFLKMLGANNIDIGCTYILAKCIFHASKPDDAGLKASLESLVEGILGMPVLKKNQTSDWSKDDLIFEQIEYAALDAIYVRKLVPELVRGMHKYKLENYYQLCKKAMHPIVELQLNGIRLDVETHRELIVAWRTKVWEAKKKVVEMTGMEKITGHTLAEWLTTNLPPDILHVWPRTETGKLMTDAHTFADFSFLPIVAPFSEYQKAEKLTTAFGMNLLGQVNKATGKLHPSFRLVGARTGRMSCSNPNLQQLPRDKEVREKFIAEDGYVFVCADYSQIELRVAAELSRDATMLRAYRDGIDLHSLTASKVSKKPISQVTKEDRQRAKAVNFGFLFGLGAKKFSHYAKKSYGADVTPQEAEEAINTFRETYSGYHKWQKKKAETSAKTLYVRTPSGKLRRLGVENTYGTAMNTPVQGGAAECMMWALIYLHDKLSNSTFDAKIVNCVHDEVTVMCKKEDTKRVKVIIEWAMTKGFTTVFPNGVTRGICECKVGNNWGEAKA